MVRACCCSRFCVSCVERLEQLLDARHVVRRLGERARELLDRGVAVELERVEVAAMRCTALFLVAMEDLRFGLDLEIAQLILQAGDRARQLAKVEIDRAELLLEPRARDADLAGGIEHLIEQLRIDAGHLGPIPLHDGLAARRHRKRRRNAFHGSRREASGSLRTSAAAAAQAAARSVPRSLIKLPVARRRLAGSAPMPAAPQALHRLAAGVRWRLNGLRHGLFLQVVREPGRMQARECCRSMRARQWRLPAFDHRLAQARELIEARLHQVEGCVVGGERRRCRSASPASRAHGSDRPWR